MFMRSLRTTCSTLAVTATFALAVPAIAQTTPPVDDNQGETPAVDVPVQPEQTAPTDAADTPQAADAPIVVTGTRLRGEVDTDAAPIDQLDQKDIASYGTSTIGELLAQLTPQTGGARGRGGGQPVVLLNGRRISGFRELRTIPSEAILRVDILPEQVALQYGYAADQRVVNFILKPNFAAVTAEVELGAPLEGGRFHQQYESSLVKIGPNGRTNLSVEYSSDGAITEAERDIVTVPVTDDGVDQTPYRTLSPATRAFTLEGTVNRYFGENTSATLNGSLGVTPSQSQQGLATATLTLPPGTDYSRAFPEYDALGRLSEGTTGHLGALVDGKLGDWRWSLTGNYDVAHSDSRTDRGLDRAILPAYVDGGGDATAGFPVTALIASEQDRARSRSRTADVDANLSGSLFDTAAGPARLSLSTGWQHFDIDGTSTRSGVVTHTDLARGQVGAKGNLDLPLASEGLGALGFLGSFSVNGNVAYRDLSDFGAITTFGYGFNWAPADWLQFTGSSSTEEGAPSLAQLGSPVVVTPNVPIFDYATGQTVFVTSIRGGNPGLIADRRNVVDLGVNIRPDKPRGLSFSANYVRVRADNPISSFPTLTPEIEAAFPGRVVRDSAGTISSIDLRAVNYLREESDRFRYGFNFSSGGGPGGGRGGRGGGGGRGGPGGGAPEVPKLNWRASIFHTVYLHDQIVIRDGLPILDRLDGSATGSNGGQPRHNIDANAGLFIDGLGGFFRVSYNSATRVDGGGAGANRLDFGSTFDLGLRLFVNFDQKESLVEKLPWLKGSRIRLSIDNLTNSVQQVRDANGATPLNYQRGFIDPLGRYVEISFRKQF